MEANKKAKELFNRYQNELVMFRFDAIKSSLIAVDEIINELKMRNCTIKYWQEVKEEINKL